eukprot:TRINITY_DN27041_c0_g1_i1.p1 TRINITY_DN27041_c0_g1~~TRINITY_DN27041_c0_g1_i1.p1  ORF type:complete len:558 (-),score=106.02 TRINITY_DN27041_c0_g1_i1:83-1726(-)
MECTICLERYDTSEHQPRILPCSGAHELCDACVKLLRRQTPITCPTCREELQPSAPVNVNRGLLAALEERGIENADASKLGSRAAKMLPQSCLTPSGPPRKVAVLPRSAPRSRNLTPTPGRPPPRKVVPPQVSSSPPPAAAACNVSRSATPRQSTARQRSTTPRQASARQAPAASTLRHASPRRSPTSSFSFDPTRFLPVSAVQAAKQSKSAIEDLESELVFLEDQADFICEQGSLISVTSSYPDASLRVLIERSLDVRRNISKKQQQLARAQEKCEDFQQLSARTDEAAYIDSSPDGIEEHQCSASPPRGAAVRNSHGSSVTAAVSSRKGSKSGLSKFAPAARTPQTEPSGLYLADFAEKTFQQGLRKPAGQRSQDLAVRRQTSARCPGGGTPGTPPAAAAALTSGHTPSSGEPKNQSCQPRQKSSTAGKPSSFGGRDSGRIAQHRGQPASTDHGKQQPGSGKQQPGSERVQKAVADGKTPAAKAELRSKVNGLCEDLLLQRVPLSSRRKLAAPRPARSRVSLYAPAATDGTEETQDSEQGICPLQ